MQAMRMHIQTPRLTCGVDFGSGVVMRPSSVRLVLLGGSLLEKIRVLLLRRLDKRRLAPESRVEKAVALRDGDEGGARKVADRRRVALGLRVHVLDTGEREQLLRHNGGDDTGTARRRDQAHLDRAALASELARNGVRHADFVAPVATTDLQQQKQQHETKR